MLDDKKKDGKKNELFFHDLINQTHGILLFLDTKSNLGPLEIETLKNEIKTLQAIAQKHYDLPHKNLNNFSDTKNPISRIKKALDKLFDIYFPETRNSFELNITGEALGEIDFIPLYRILNNLVKNMSEAKIANAQFIIDFNELGLSLSTSNIIVEENALQTEQGLGLLSITSVVNELGGSFQYEIHGQKWLNHLYIPYRTPDKNSSLTKKIAA